MKKWLALLLCLLIGRTCLAAAEEPVLPRYVAAQTQSDVRTETSQTGGTAVTVGRDDLMQVIGYSYDMEGNLWWRVIDYRSGKDGYIMAAALDEMDEAQAEQKKTWIDMMTPTPIPTPTPTAKYPCPGKSLKNAVNVRRTASSSGSVVGKIKQGEVLTVLGEKEGLPVVQITAASEDR